MKRYVLTILFLIFAWQSGFAQREVLDRVIAVVDANIVLQS